MSAREPWFEDEEARMEKEGLLGGRQSTLQHRRQVRGDILRKHEQIDDISRSITDVQEIFQDFASLVKGQQIAIDDIESNIQDTKEKTEEALKEVVTASDYSRRRRNALCYTLFFVLLVTAGVGIFAYELSSV
mmetsp:Transcript_21475/g.31946  ORF Transcript_21475/g.31946 Transcript_21475/m.31946 type:complete len:133 (+) Transcript_21475:42-440(+)